MLGISIAFARLIARSRKKGIVADFKRKNSLAEKIFKSKPLIFFNLINGGAHAKNNLDIQEYMVVVGTGGFFRYPSLMIHEELGKFLKMKYNLPVLESWEMREAIPWIFQATSSQSRCAFGRLDKRNKFGSTFRIALDAAAIFSERRYRFDGLNLSTGEMSEVNEFYLKSPFGSYVH